MPPPRRFAGLSGTAWLLCASGFLMSMKPDEPFLTNALVDWKGLSETDVDQQVYPYWTYAYLVWLLPTTIAVEYLGVRLVVCVGFAAHLATYGILLFGFGLPLMQLMQVTFGLSSACEPVFYALVYQRIARDEIERATGYMRAAVLAGHLIAGLIGQALVSSGYPYKVLFIISNVNLIASILVLALYYRLTKEQTDATEPQPDVDLDPTSKESGENSDALPRDTTLAFDSWVSLVRAEGWKKLYDTVITEYKLPSVLTMSIWWWFGNSVLELVLNYDTDLFYERAPDVDYNGAVEAAGRGSAAATALLPSLLSALSCCKLDLSFASPSSVRPLLGLLFVFDGVGGFLLGAMAMVVSVYTLYVLFVLFYAFIQFIVTLASASIAENCNTLVSVFFQTIVQLVIGHQALHLKSPAKFGVFAVQLFILSAGYLAALIYHCCFVTVTDDGEKQQPKLDKVDIDPDSPTNVWSSPLNPNQPASDANDALTIAAMHSVTSEIDATVQVTEHSTSQSH